MPKFRKRPVEIEAVQVTLENMERPDWLRDAIRAGVAYWQGGDDPHYSIRTLEGVMRANLLDWIIKGVKGELYPCKPEIFAATYEAVE